MRDEMKNLSTAMNTWLSSLPRAEAPAQRRARPALEAAVPVEHSQRSHLPASASLGVLTRREVDVLGLLAADCTYAQAAARLGVSPHTVVTHVKNAYRKLDVHSAAAAVMRALELGVPLRKGGAQ